MGKGDANLHQQIKAKRKQYSQLIKALPKDVCEEFKWIWDRHYLGSMFNDNY